MDGLMDTEMTVNKSKHDIVSVEVNFMVPYCQFDLCLVVSIQ